jgi:hypothetical protein
MSCWWPPKLPAQFVLPSIQVAYRVKPEAGLLPASTYSALRDRDAVGIGMRRHKCVREGGVSAWCKSAPGLVATLPSKVTASLRSGVGSNRRFTDSP